MGERACSRCIAITKKGTRCSLNTCAVGPKCWMHTLADENLRVKQSHIKEAGKGLYAQKGFRLNKSNNEVVFKKGATIGPYTGEILSAEQVKRLPKSKKTYILQQNPNRLIACLIIPIQLLFRSSWEKSFVFHFPKIYRFFQKTRKKSIKHRSTNRNLYQISKSTMLTQIFPGTIAIEPKK